jgi:hypothetical protein
MAVPTVSLILAAYCPRKTDRGKLDSSRLSVSLAKAQRLDEASVSGIHKQCGNHFYTKGDYDGAMQQYAHTIRHLEASYVIRKVCFSISCPKLR